METRYHADSNKGAGGVCLSFVGALSELCLSFVYSSCWRLDAIATLHKLLVCIEKLCHTCSNKGAEGVCLSSD